jgi:HSP20 family protein
MSDTNDPFRRLADVQREIGAVTLELFRAQMVYFRPSPGWQPSINAFRCAECFLVCVDLAGINRAAIQLLAESRRLTVRGSRSPIEPTGGQLRVLQVLAMEIDHGPFERILELPAEVDADRVTAEQRDGLLWIQLPLRANA